MTSSNTSSSTSSSSVQRIDRFDGPNRFLSNFWPVNVPLYNQWYPSVEHAYQSAKSNDEKYKREVRKAATPGDAKRLGKKAPLRPDWGDAKKLEYMEFLVWYKFAMYPDLGKMLLATGDAELIEGNTWGDTFWGVCKGVGQNQLGKLLMKVRDQVRRNGVAESPPEMPKPKIFVPRDATFEPEPGHVFVFGSNRAGVHGAGAALYAAQSCGAIMGKGEGLMPSSEVPLCYGIPTKDHQIQTLPLEEIKVHIDKFIELAWERRDLTFFVTRLGCGLAGFTDYQIAPLFRDAPPNCELPPGWERFEEEYGLG